MVERHFAFFDALTGAYVREAKGLVPPPNVHPLVRGVQREQALIIWATSVSGGRPGEIGLDVTRFNYPLGDFCWSRFDLVDHALVLEEPHHFIEVTPSTGMLDVNWQSPRPVRSSPDKLVADITGTPWEAQFGSLFGQLVTRDGRLFVSNPAQRLLSEAPIALDVTQVNVGREVGASVG